MTGFVQQISVGIAPMDRRNGAVATIQMKLGYGRKQSYKQEQLVAALLSHALIEVAAKSIGVADTTEARWMKKPEPQAAYREARREAMR
jgi:hypothetical protein